MDEDLKQKNLKLTKILVLVVIGMFCFGYALVPIYDVLCKVFERDRPDLTAKQEKVFPVDSRREVTVEFLTTLNETTAMEFRAETKLLTVHPGQYHTVNFYAENKTDQVMVAQAIPSFSPGSVAKYFNKIECFCFNQQTFKPRESKRMPMRFVINPELPKDFKTITLSYTFFDNTKTAAQR